MLKLKTNISKSQQPTFFGWPWKCFVSKIRRLDLQASAVRLYLCFFASPVATGIASPREMERSACETWMLRYWTWHIVDMKNQDHEMFFGIWNIMKHLLLGWIQWRSGMIVERGENWGSLATIALLCKSRSGSLCWPIRTYIRKGAIWTEQGIKKKFQTSAFSRFQRHVFFFFFFFFFFGFTVTSMPDGNMNIHWYAW